MKTLRSLLLPLLALAALPALAAEAPHPSLYSFADVYRLTVAGEPFGGFRFADAEAQIRVAAAPATKGAPELHFSVSAPHDDARWALLLAGLSTCAWVAHRRLASPYG